MPYLSASAVVIHYEEVLYIKCMHLYRGTTVNFSPIPAVIPQIPLPCHSLVAPRIDCDSTAFDCLSMVCHKVTVT